MDFDDDNDEMEDWENDNNIDENDDDFDDLREGLVDNSNDNKDESESKTDESDNNNSENNTENDSDNSDNLDNSDNSDNSNDSNDSDFNEVDFEDDEDFDDELDSNVNNVATIDRMEVAEKWLEQAKKCLCHYDYFSALHAANTMLKTIINERDITPEMYEIVAVANSQCGKLDTAVHFINMVEKEDRNAEYLNIKALLYINKYESVQANGNDEDIKYLERAEKFLTSAIKKSHKKKEREIAGIASGLLARIYYLYGRYGKAKEYINRARGLGDPWRISEEVDKLLQKRKSKRTRNILTVIGVILFVVITVCAAGFLYLCGDDYTGKYAITSLLFAFTTFAILICSTFFIVYMWAANSSFRRHGGIPAIIITILNFLAWATVIVFLAYEFFP